MREFTEEKITQIHMHLNKTLLGEYDRGLITNEPVKGYIYFKHELLNEEPYKILILRFHDYDQQGDYVFYDSENTKYVISKNCFPYHKIHIDKKTVHEIFISET